MTGLNNRFGRLATLLERIREPEPPPPGNLSDVIYTLLVLLVAMILIGAVVGAVLSNNDPSPTSLLLGWTVGGLIATFIIGAAHRRTPEKWTALRLSSLPDTRLRNVLLVSLSATILLDLSSAILTGQFLPAPEVLRFTSVSVDVGSWFLAALFLVIVQPVAEELVFRGVTLPRLRMRLGLWSGLVVTAALYALFHALVYDVSGIDHPGLLWYVLAVPFIAGLIMGLVRLGTGSTRAAILAHLSFGLFALLKSYLLL